jgi:hypothetical protein
MKLWTLISNCSTTNLLIFGLIWEKWKDFLPQKITSREVSTKTEEGTKTEEEVGAEEEIEGDVGALEGVEVETEEDEGGSGAIEEVLEATGVVEEGLGATGVVEVGLEVIEETEGGFVVIMLGVPIGVLREGDFGAKEPTLGDPLQEISREAEGIGKILVKYFF